MSHIQIDSLMIIKTKPEQVVVEGLILNLFMFRIPKITKDLVKSLEGITISEKLQTIA